MGCIGLLSAIVLVCICVTWMIYPYHPLKVIDPLEPAKLTIKAGDAQIFRFHYCKSTNRNGEVSVTLKNSSLIHFPGYIVTHDKGCYIKNISLAIPDYAEPGMYVAEYYIEYKMNPLRTIGIIFDTETFQIID